MSKAKSGALTANVVANVPITDHNQVIQVVNRSQTGEIWVRLDGIDPTVAGDDCFVVLGARRFAVPDPATAAVSIRLISSAALNYTVEGAL